MTHIITYIIGIVSGMFLLANTKAIKMPIIVNDMSMNEQALLTAAFVIAIGLTIRAIARNKASSMAKAKKQ